MPFRRVAHPVYDRPAAPAPREISPIPTGLYPVPEVAHPERDGGELVANELTIGPTIECPEPLGGRPRGPGAAVFFNPDGSTWHPT